MHNQYQRMMRKQLIVFTELFEYRLICLMIGVARSMRINGGCAKGRVDYFSPNSSLILYLWGSLNENVGAEMLAMDLRRSCLESDEYSKYGDISVVSIPLSSIIWKPYFRTYF